MWVYRARMLHPVKGPAREVWEVGFFCPDQGIDGWEAPIRVDTAAEAKLWTHYLNGGDAPKGLEPA